MIVAWLVPREMLPFRRKFGGHAAVVSGQTELQKSMYLAQLSKRKLALITTVKGVCVCVCVCVHACVRAFARVRECIFVRGFSFQ